MSEYQTVIYKISECENVLFIGNHSSHYLTTPFNYFKRNNPEFTNSKLMIEIIELFEYSNKEDLLKRKQYWIDTFNPTHNVKNAYVNERQRLNGFDKLIKRINKLRDETAGVIVNPYIKDAFEFAKTL